MTSTELSLGLGAALRKARGARSLALSEVSAATGISASFLSLVENGRSDITIGRLVRLVDFYGLSLADLIQDTPPADPDIVRRDEQGTLPSPAEGIEFRLLAANSPALMLPMMVGFEPDAHLSGVRSPSW